MRVIESRVMAVRSEFLWDRPFWLSMHLQETLSCRCIRELTPDHISISNPWRLARLTNP